MSDEKKIKECEAIADSCEKKAEKILETARQMCAERGWDTAEVDKRMADLKQDFRKPQGKFKAALVDACVMIDKWDNGLVSAFVVNPYDGKLILAELGDDLTDEEILEERRPLPPFNTIGEIWDVLILEDSECPAGMIIAVADGKKVGKVSDMIAIADKSEKQGKDGYAYLNGIK